MPQSPKLVNTVPFVEESPSIEEIASIMSSQASRRLTAISNQLSPKPAGDTFDGIPLVKKVGPDASQPRVKDKVVIITGANSPLGIGRAAAHQFASHGARAVYICDLDGSHLDTHKREITALYPAVDVHTRQFNAADDKAVKAVVDDALAQYGRLDVFFGNAGTTGAHKVFTDISDEEFMDILRVNTLRYTRPSHTSLLEPRERD
jgi:shikimate 5-dehydrogenase